MTAALGLDVLPGRYALEHGTAHYTGAARWDGTRWAPALGVPGRIAVNVTDDKHLLAEAVDVLGELTEGEPDRAASADLLAALRTGEWDEASVEAALRCTSYEDEELAAQPDTAAAHAALDEFRPVLCRACGLPAREEKSAS